MTAPEPFRGAEQAWFWTMAQLRRQNEGRPRADAVRRPCTPDDVVKCLDQLYRHRRIDLSHVRVLRLWGERQVTPRTGRTGGTQDGRLWQEAMERLGWPLRAKGIVVAAPGNDAQLTGLAS